MLLFVAKRAPSGYTGIMSASSAASQLGSVSFPGAASQWAQSRSQSAIPASAVTAAHANGLGPEGKVINGAGAAGKKGKSQSQSAMPIGAFAGVNSADLSSRSMNPYIGSSSLHLAKGRESYRSKILASILGRQGGGRATLFQVPSFLLASICIRNDALRRLLSQLVQGTPPVGQLGLYHPHPSWTRACYKLNSSAKKSCDSAL
jgi:hypothetical protein